MSLRVVAIGLLIIIPCMAGEAASALSAREKNELVGPVRTVTTKGSGISETENYDTEGNLLEVVTYLEHEKSTTRYLFAYNHRGTLLEENAYRGNGTLLYRNLFAYAYDVQGHETAAVAASPDGVFRHAEFSLYDNRGYLSEKLHSNASGISRNVFDIRGHVVYSAQFKDGELLSEVTYFYDNWGKRVGLVSYGPTGAVTGKNKNEYDDSGKQVRRTAEKFQQGAASGRSVTIYEYDGVGNWVKALMKNESSESAEPATAPYHMVQERIIIYYGKP